MLRLANCPSTRSRRTHPSSCAGSTWAWSPGCWPACERRDGGGPGPPGRRVPRGDPARRPRPPRRPRPERRDARPTLNGSTRWLSRRRSLAQGKPAPSRRGPAGGFVGRSSRKRRWW